MVPFLLIAGALLFWLYYSGRLAKMQPGDWFALAIAVLGTRVLTTGQLPAAGAMLAGAIGWALYRSRSHKPDAEAGKPGNADRPYPEMSIAEARMLLGIDERASAGMIRAAWRRRMARAHPDAGGNAELASKLNAARDLLLENQAEKTDSPLS
ncbi:MAG: molecular chaperone DnaJ [Pseudomonadota bacterium]